MHGYTLTQLSDSELIEKLGALVARDRSITAALLAHIAEVDTRRLYAPAGYPSMHAYCVRELRYSEDEAKKRIQASRAARRFPSIFHAVAEGRLHLSGICLLAPHLTPGNARELVESSLGKTRSEIEALLARRYPVPREPVCSVRPIAAVPEPEWTHSTPGPVFSPADLPEGAPGHPPSQREDPNPDRPAERYFLQFSIGRSTRERLQYAQDLLSHAVPDGDVGQILDRALRVLIPWLEKRKFGAVHTRDRVVAALCALGCGAREARRAADSSPEGATLEEGILAALQHLSPHKAGARPVRAGRST